MNEQIGFYDKIKLLETLQKVDKISPEIAASLSKSLRTNISLLNYFVTHFNNPVVIRELHKKGFFDELPSPAEQDKEVRRRWSEGVILVRLADKIPDVVSDIIRKTKTNDQGVYAILLEAAVKLDIDLVKELWPELLKWIDNCQWNYYPTEYKQICQEFLKRGYCDEVKRCFETVLEPLNPPVQQTENRVLKHNEAIGKFDHWELDEYIKPLLNSLEDIPFLLSLAELFEKYLIQCVDIECVASNSDHCKTSYWRSAIEDHEQDVHKEHHKDFLLDMLRDTLQKVLQKEPETIRDKVCTYLKHEYLIFRRLALHLIRLGKDSFLDIAFEQLSNSEILDELYTHHEVFLLLRDIYPILPQDQQKKILSVIKEGPSKTKVEEIAEWHEKNYPRHGDRESYRRDYTNVWIRARLQMIKGNLIEADLDYYKNLVAKYQESDHPDFTHYIGPVGFVAQKSPITEEEFANKTAKECVELMMTWQPKDSDDFLERISPKGLADVFKQSLNKRWVEFTPEFEGLITKSVFPTYTHAILDYISEKLKKCEEKNERLDEVYNIRELVEVVSWSCDKWAYAKLPREDLEYGYGNSVCTESLRFLGQLLVYLDKNNFVISEELFLKIKNIIKKLCVHPDPEPKIDNPQDEKYMGYHDPMTVSINHIRPMSLRELLRYALCRSIILKLKENKVRWEEDVKEKVTEMLIDDKALSVRSVFAECWGWLFYLDEVWATKYHKSIFPDEPSDEYFVTAWDSYITHKDYVKDWGYALMRPLYIRAIDNAINKKVTNTHLAPIDSLSEHLAGFYRFDIEQLRMDGTVDRTNPLEYLYSLKPNRLHSHFIWSMWRICDEGDDIEECRKIWEKAKTLWKFRLKSVASEDRNKSFSAELTWFLYFLNIEKLNISPSEIKDLLIETIPLLGKDDTNHGLDALTKYLVRASADNIEFSTELLLKTLEIHGAGAYAGWYIRKNDVEGIIKNAVNGNFEVKRKGIKVIHKLGEYGQHWAREYLDKLRM